MLAAGTVLGLLVGLIAQYEELSVVVSAERITLTRKGKDQQFASDRVVRAFLDGKQLVLLGDGEGELARETCDLDAQRVAEAFRAHGYAWVDEDPYQDDFRRWVPDMPGLPPGADALLKARARLLEKKGSAEDLRELREELARLGVVVRDEARRQHWRLNRGRG
ncbi:YqeB family protein [Streptomyces sp. bgisy084]|uniref:YqeB family protein n=1 Tax=Streptomyces sp. bgisy084 TaxID=3413777 RepID=UPI003D75597A